MVSARSAQAAAARRPEWTFHLIEDVGHVPQIEQPEATAATILQWLTENPDVVRTQRWPDSGSPITEQHPWARLTHPSTLNAPHRNVRTVN